ncbi:MAG: histidinol-phosphate transaminase [Pseudomonadales bacterium]|nr:histidinol-phosphate transaminase [Pseudomonadales bacterium]
MDVDWVKRARPAVQAIQPYVPGKPLEEAQRELGLASLVKLASNENPYGPSQKVLDAVADMLPACNRYPDGNGFYLKALLAEKHAVAPASITLGNGSNDILELVASAFLEPGTNAIYAEYAFIIYALAVARSAAEARVAPAKNYAHDLDAILAKVDERTRVIYLANPNNPTGTYFSQAALQGFLQALPRSVIVVLDEAYFEYVEAVDYSNGLALQQQFENLLVTRTFSKAYGLSGFRVGYSISHPAIADVLNRVRQPFNVASPSLLAAQIALSDGDYLQRAVACNNAGMQQLCAGLREMGLAFIPSVANFVTFDAGEHAAQINQQLLQRGVIVRPVANYAMPRHLRVSIGLEEENRKFLDALALVLQAQKN